MLRHVTLSIAVLLTLLLGAPASALASDPAVHDEASVVGDQFVCGSTTYTITQGTVHSVMHETTNASGNTSFTFTLTPRNVVAINGATTVAIVGAFWVGATFQPKNGNGQFTITAHFQLVEQGTGTIGRVQSIFHMSPNGKVTDHDFSTCLLPPDE
jgi:hypothetical protein